MLPEIAGFEAGRFPVEALVVWDAAGGWHAATVLHRTGAGPVMVHPQWSEPFTLAPTPWEYLAERVRDGRGGNGYDYDVWGFEVADPADIASVITAWEADVATKGPFIQIVGTLETGIGSEATEVDVMTEEAPVEATPSFLVAREAPPDWLRRPLPDVATDELIAKSGEDPRWGFAIPWLYRALAAPLTFEPMPALGDPPDRHPDALGYWTALLHMLLYSLGWARPDRGLRWWYDTGRPTDDPRLALLEHVWRQDGYLEHFAEWACRTPLQATSTLGALTGYRDDGVRTEPHPDWRAARRHATEHSPFGVDRDPYHLPDHSRGPLAEPRGTSLLLRSGRTERHAMLVLDSMVGWYRALSEQTATLPSLEGRSWHVDVVVRPAGWLGTYRRSRVTGLWFTGRHRSHTRGT